MKKTFVKCFALAMLLLGSMSTYAVDWSSYSFIGSDGGNYDNKYKVEAVANLTIANIQQKDGKVGIYVSVPAAITKVSVDSKIEGAGTWLYLSSFAAQETEVTIEYAPSNTITFHVYYVDGTPSGDGDGDGDGDGEQPTEPTSIDWTKYSFLGSAAGDQYTNKYKVETIANLNIANVQPTGDKVGIYVSVPAAITKVSVDSKIEGAGTWLYLSSFTAQETEVTIEYAPSNTITFHVYYADGTTGGDQTEPSVLTAIELTANPTTIEVGQTSTITAVAKDQYNKKMDAEISLTVAPEGIGTITNGVFTAAQVGTATITATAGTLTKTVEVTIVAAPTAAPAAPTYPADQVKAVYSATYNADCGFGEWGSGTVCTQDTYGKKYVFGSGTYFGLIDFGDLNCANMEKLHFDIYTLEAGTVRVVPIRRGQTEVGVTTSTLVAGQWNSIDIALSDFINATDWTDVFQIKIDNATMKTIWLNNVYFYTTVAPTADTEAPTDLTAALADASYFSANIKAKATDNSGVVVFKVLNGTTELATKSANSATETTITISGLTAGTEYNLTVAAYDEAGNKAATDVTVNLTTKAAPAPAAAPTMDADDVFSIYSDAYTPDVNLTIGQWGQTTAATEVNLADNDKAYLCTNSNYLGLELNATIDVTAKPYIHIDVYVETAGSIQFTPIWGDEKLKAYTLNAGWTALDIDLTADFAGINLANINQLKFAVMPATCFFDNVFFYSKPTTPTSIIEAADNSEKAVKAIENGQLVIIRDGVRYNAQGQTL